MSGSAKSMGFALAVLGVVTVMPVPGSAQTLSLRPVLQGTRIDLKTGELLIQRRSGVDLSLAELTLPSNFKLRGLRDETLSFSVVVSSETASVAAVRLSAPAPLIGEVFAAAGLRVDDPSQSDMIYPLGPATYPDPLVPTTTVSVAAKEHALLWIDLFIPEKATAGEHACQLQIGRQIIDFVVEILPFTLPRQDVAKLGTVNFGSFVDRGRQDPKQLLRWMQMAHAHHLSIELRVRAPIKDGVIDWAAWEKTVGPWVTGEAFTEAAGYVGPRAGLPTTQLILPHSDSWPSPRTEKSMPSDVDALGKALREWEQLAIDRGWFDMPHATTWVFFVNSMDEPKKVWMIPSLAAWGPLLEKVGLQDRKHIEFRVDGNFGQKLEGYDEARQIAELGDVVDIWNLHGADWTIPWEMMKTRRDAGDERLMMYISNSSGEPTIPPTVLDAPLNGLRAWGWYAPRYGFTGLLNWEVDLNAPDCIENLKCSPGGRHVLDANLIFRGDDVGGKYDAPIASMRIKMLRRGAQDAGLWTLVAERNPAIAQVVLQGVLQRAVEDGIGHNKMGAWPVSPEIYEGIRERMINALVDTPPKKLTINKPVGYGWWFLLLAAVGFALGLWIKSR